MLCKALIFLSLSAIMIITALPNGIQDTAVLNPRNSSTDQGCNPVQVAKLRDINGQGDDNFGFSVAVSGDVILIGAWATDDHGGNAGSAFVFRFNGTNWVRETRLLPAEVVTDDHFGWSVALFDDVAIVGAYLDDGNGHVNNGTAYIFRYNGTDWVQEANLLPAALMDYDHFGYSVSISGNVAFVGATGDDSGGAAYVFRYDGTNWNEEAKILPSVPCSGDSFGRAVPVSGNVAVIGAPYHDFNGSDAGAAYVFRYDGTNWVEEAKLMHDDPVAFDEFGRITSVSGDVAVIGAPYHDRIPGNDSNTGAAYVFRYDGTSWSQEAKLTALDFIDEANFGYAASVSSDVTVIGAYRHRRLCTEGGAAYVFKHDGANWIEEAKLEPSDLDPYDHYGNSTSVSGDVAVVGCKWDDVNATNSGSAYVYNLNCSNLLTAFPDLLMAGRTVSFTAMNMNPNTDTYLAYSLKGKGSTYVSLLDVTLDLTKPKQANGMIVSDSTGKAEWTFTIPTGAAGRDLWAQACQHSTKTNYIVTSIQ